MLVDQFDSKEDLINAVITSSFIPGYTSCVYNLYMLLGLLIYWSLIKLITCSRYLAPTPATMFRNRLCVDGGLTLFMPPTSASKTVFFWPTLCGTCKFSYEIKVIIFFLFCWYHSQKSMCIIPCSFYPSTFSYFHFNFFSIEY